MTETSTRRRPQRRSAHPGPLPRRATPAHAARPRVAHRRAVQPVIACRGELPPPPSVEPTPAVDAQPVGSAAPRLAAARPDRPAVLRLTRRGRVVLLLVLCGLLLGAFSMGRVSSSAASHGVAHRVVVVHPGDTLWSIAKRVAPGTDPRDEVARIAAANHLPSSDVRAGQQLLLPGD